MGLCKNRPCIQKDLTTVDLKSGLHCTPSIKYHNKGPINGPETKTRRKGPSKPSATMLLKCLLVMFPGSQLFPRESIFPEGVKFSRGSQLFLRESTFPEEVNFSQGSHLFLRESTFPEEVNFSQGSQLFPRKSNIPEEVNFAQGSQLFPLSLLILFNHAYYRDISRSRCL